MVKKNEALAIEETPKSNLSSKPAAPNTYYVSSSNNMNSSAPVSEIKKGPKTRITVKYDVGFGNYLFLRGKGATLSWEKGTVLKNVKNDEWIWETEIPFTTCEFKVLMNDKRYEIGENHTLTCGASIQYTPRF